MRGEVTARQARDLEAEIAQPSLREIDLPVFEGILVAASYHERELISIGAEEPAEVEPIALSFVIGHEARSCREVEQTIVAAHGAVEFANFGGS